MDQIILHIGIIRQFIFVVAFNNSNNIRDGNQTNTEASGRVLFGSVIVGFRIRFGSGTCTPTDVRIQITFFTMCVYIFA